MSAAIARGPAQRPAPGAFQASVSDSARPRFRTRRQIGIGSRPIIVTDPARITSRRIAQPIKRGRNMQRSTGYVTTFFALFLSVAALGIGAAVDTPRTLMSRADYAQGRKAIEGEARTVFARCRTESGTARDICKAEARAAERVKLADLSVRYHGTVVAAEDARQARARAQFDLAKARCTSQAGEARVECLRTAREDRGRELEAKLASN